MDEFSQSRGDDDLFDDDFVPVEVVEEVEEIAQLDRGVRKVSLENHLGGSPLIACSSGTHHDHGDKIAGQKEALPSSELRQDPQYQRSQLDIPSPSPIAVTSPENLATGNAPRTSSLIEAFPTDADAKTTEVADGTSNSTQDPDHDSQVRSGAGKAAPVRPPAVRGDRTATGGVKKPKLSEEELTAKLAAAKTRSQNLSAAHARAEADAASFEERERAAVKEKTRDVANHKAMESEREKNRARKMAVAGGREWDALKPAAEERSGRGGERPSRPEGGVGDEPPDDLSQYEWKDRRNDQRGRGMRGGWGSGNDQYARPVDHGRGQARGRGRGRGRGSAAARLDVIAKSDFPPLPAASSATSVPPRASSRHSPGVGESQNTPPSAEASSWADQMDRNEASAAE